MRDGRGRRGLPNTLPASLSGWAGKGGLSCGFVGVSDCKTVGRVMGWDTVVVAVMRLCLRTMGPWGMDWVLVGLWSGRRRGWQLRQDPEKAPQIVQFRVTEIIRHSCKIILWTAVQLNFLRVE